MHPMSSGTWRSLCRWAYPSFVGEGPSAIQRKQPYASRRTSRVAAEALPRKRACEEAFRAAFKREGRPVFPRSRIHDVKYRPVAARRSVEVTRLLFGGPKFELYEQIGNLSMEMA